jgi:hypothetical protein
MAATKGNRWGHRDATMVLLAFRHGLRASWSKGLLHVRRVKQGTPATHLTGRELRALRRLQREQTPKSPFVFVSERGTPLQYAASRPWWNARLARRAST